METLRELINNEEWIIGAINYDEDLHFGSYYLRGSYSSNTVDLYPGYTHHIAFYENFNEYYYLLKKECITNSAAIIEKALLSKDWLPGILQDIVKQSDIVKTIFSPATSLEMLAGLTNTELQSLYSRHDDIHKSLYKVARVPEALDRGVSYFSNYLKNHLYGLGLNSEEVETHFITLAQPVTPSILSQELVEFNEIVDFIRSISADASILNQPRRARMFLPASILERLLQHLNKWRYFEYHGYGRRQPTDLAAYIDRLIVQLTTPYRTFNSRILMERLEDNKQARERCFEQLSLDSPHRTLFEMYTEIGIVKLYRKYAQLRNFYFLDMVLYEIAKRLQTDEMTIRCMLPNEVMLSLAQGKLCNPSIIDRKGGCVFTLINNKENVTTSVEAVKLRKQLSKNTPPLQPDKKTLKGTVASKGRVTGTCRVVIRADDQVSQFVDGSILISESTDLDVIKFFSAAGAVLTEQGGVGSHAAILCRELGIPAIIGIEGLLERIKDGDEVEVNAFTGEVKLLPRKSLPIIGLAYNTDQQFDVNIIGAKAHNLGHLKRMGASIPDYILLSYDKVKYLVSNDLREELYGVAAWIKDALKLSDLDVLAVRSSAISEDTNISSRAGMYTSLLDVYTNSVPDALREFVKQNDLRDNTSLYHGSIIVQKMVPADFSGVCLTLDDRTGYGNSLVIEVVPGISNGLTSGTMTPDRVIIDRLTGDIIQEIESKNGIGIDTLDIVTLKDHFLVLESRFGTPLDIEWAVVRQKLFILQARPIVK